MTEPSFGPDLYRRNGFRVTGLPVDAPTRVVRRRRREMSLDVPAPRHDPMPLEPPPTTTEVNQAFARIDDPRSRIVDELTWVWSSTAGSAPQGVDSSSVAAHDRTVLAHCSALELERRDGALTDAQRRERDEAWSVAMRGWRSMADDERIWAHLQRRRAELNDARLSDGDVAALRAGTTRAVLAVNAQLAVAGTDGDAERHRRLMTELSSEADVNEAVRAAAGGLVARVDDALAAARAAGDADVAAARSLADQVRGPMTTLRTLLPTTDPLLLRLGDGIASQLRQVAVVTLNQAQTGARPDLSRIALVAGTAAELLAEARTVAVGSGERESIDRDAATCRSIQDSVVRLGGRPAATTRTTAPASTSRPVTRPGRPTPPRRPANPARARSVWAVLGGLVALLTSLTAQWNTASFLGVAGWIGSAVLVLAGLMAADRARSAPRGRALTLLAVAVILLLTLDPYSATTAVAVAGGAGIAYAPGTAAPLVTRVSSIWLAGVAGLLVATLWVGSTWVAAVWMVVFATGFVLPVYEGASPRGAGVRCGLVGVLALAAWLWWGGGTAFLVAGLVVLVGGGLLASEEALEPTVPRALVIATLGVVGVIAGIVSGTWWLWTPGAIVALAAAVTAVTAHRRSPYRMVRSMRRMM